MTRIRRGEAVVQEYRILRPRDSSFRWIRSTGFPILDEHGQLRRIAGIASDVTDAKLSSEHQTVLLAELQHRVRNIMAVIRSIITRTGERAQSVGEYAELAEGRILTLARVQALLTSQANVGISIATIVRNEVSAQARYEEQFELSGPDIVLSPK